MKKVHVSVVVNEDESADCSFWFGGATIGQLSMLNHELDIIKMEILERIRDTPGTYDIKHYENKEDEEDNT